ncbi:MYND finger [Apiospora saccharicola]
MRVPTIASYISQFYPIGNTPAVCLTRGLPQGVDADILLLGSGDVRNILYTAYANEGLPPRKLNFTCCDVETAVAGKFRDCWNALLLSLIIDRDDNKGSSVSWNIYYDIYLTKAAAAVLEAQLEKLLAASDTLETWRQSSYGEAISFCDEGSLDLTREFWRKCLTSARALDKSTLEKELRRTRQLETGGEQNLMLTGIRSASPVAIHAMMSLPETHAHYWKAGSLTESNANVPNPLMGSILSQHTLLHRATDPVLGFHLATAFANIASGSPLRIDGQSKGKERLVQAATTQFREWVKAFQSQLKHGVTVSFAVADALNFCQALKDASSGSNKAPTVYRRQFDMSGYQLDPDRCSSSDSKGLLFDVVDTSNLADHLGAVNLLALASPLLKPIGSSTLYVETLIKGTSHRQAELDDLLLGHAPMISLILGVSAVESWTNATSTSAVDAIVIGAAYNQGNEHHLHSRIAWKRDRSLSTSGESAQKLYVDPDALSGIFFGIYHRMFENEDPYAFMGAAQDQMLVTMRKSAYPRFHRGSLVALLKHAHTTVNTEWPLVYQSLVNKIQGDRKLLLGSLYVQEMTLHMHNMGIFTDKWLENEIKRDPRADDFSAWNDVPAAVAVTLVVPRARFNKIYDADPSKRSAPTLQVGFASSKPGHWQNFFADVQLAFGTVEPQGHPKEDSFQVSVNQDANGWGGSSNIVASVMVPTAALQVEPGSTKVSLRIQTTAHSLSTFRNAGLGPELVVYETDMADAAHVFVTRNLPGLPLFAPGLEDELKGLSVSKQQYQMTANVDASSARLLTLTGHVDITTGQGKKLLEDKVPIELRQTSPFTIEIVFGKDDLVIPVVYPIPVDQESSKTRIARKSSYVEVIAPLANPLKSNALASYLFPTMLGPDAIPITLNGQNLSLDRLPILNVDPQHKRENQWLVTLTSHVFSINEKRLRDTGKTDAGVNKDLRVNFKESVFTMYMLASGLQGGQTGLFSLNQPEKGIVLLIFVQCIRIDAAAGSVVADAAILPLTLDIVLSKKLEDFFLVLRELEICAITVNDEELRLWKQVIPDMVERCRTWNHTADCEYKKPGAKIPLTMETGKQLLCSCGNGKLPANYMKIPGWDLASKYAVRAAISPTFSVPFVEDIVNTDGLGPGRGVQEMTAASEKCRSCGKAKTAAGGKLMQCARCKEVAYCSKECQKADWKKHRQECA